MSDVMALVSGAAADPDNDLNRIVLADYFQDRDDPREDLIRVQFELIETRDKMTALDTRLEDPRRRGGVGKAELRREKADLVRTGRKQESQERRLLPRCRATPVAPMQAALAVRLGLPGCGP